MEWLIATSCICCVVMFLLKDFKDNLRALFLFGVTVNYFAEYETDNAGISLEIMALLILTIISFLFYVIMIDRKEEK